MRGANFSISLTPCFIPFSPKPCHPTKPFANTFETLAMAKSVDESDVGIYCYVSSLPGFRAVLKQRYSDFIVNEVDLDGNIVRLTSFDLPPKCSKEEERKASSDQKCFTDEIELFQTLAGEANAKLLKEFLEKVASTVGDELPPIVLAPDSDKSHRTEVHNFFKTNFKFLVTDTVDGEDGNSKCVRIRFSSGKGVKGRGGRKRKDMENSGRKNDIPFDSRGTDNWPEERGKFLRFNLYKENKDTHEALGVIGKMLGIQQRSFGFAGTKDKRAITTQRVTVFKLHPERLAALNCRLFGIKVGDFCFLKKGLLLGQLLGNRFTITLRGVVAASVDTINAAADGLGRSGFINYYGLQRFGSGSVPTHSIGAALLRGEWKTAVDLILDPRDGERADIKEARKKYKKTGNADLVLSQLPRYLVAERAIIQCLKNCPGNYLQALQGIPRTLRLMYVHSYQSYLWNHAASMRVRKHGTAQVVVGDLVFCKGPISEKVASFESVEPIYEYHDGEGNNSLLDISDVALPEEKIQLVKTINSDDLISGGYTFEDVVLPLPGSRTIYPGNDIAGIYHDISKKDGVSLTESVHGVKEFSITSMTGDYRRVFQRPIDYTWELLTYTDNNESLAKTDMDILVGSKNTDLVTNKSSINTSPDDKDSLQTRKRGGSDCFMSEDQNGVTAPAECDYSDPKVALKLGFTLPASCYATMAIRELLKSSTLVSIYISVLNAKKSEILYISKRTSG
ncbi:multisubstrate pseudouridine synthase 7 [Dendrobium catenatum]|uniref:multisubstrate pseudouridine synthase 7 n=1 Tax=Dendrobium catenatum TaxID=906689 RepID=UPI0010A0AB88|nr:multisubstrate pseudouridine synthase 7 [Dendrobium catenatum]